MTIYRTAPEETYWWVTATFEMRGAFRPTIRETIPILARDEAHAVEQMMERAKAAGSWIVGEVVARRMTE